MQDLLNAIQTLAVHDWVDYCAVFAPIILSAVAIWISISTTRKQNDIALFDKRFEFCGLLQKCISFGGVLVNIESKEKILTHFNTIFCDCFYSDIESEIDIKIMLEYRKISAMLSQGELIFNYNLTKEMQDLDETLKQLIFLV